MDLDFLKQLVVMLTIVTLVGAVSAIILADFREDMQEDDTTSAINESLTLSSGTATVSQSTLFISATACMNSSGDGIETSGANAQCNISATGVVTAAAGINFTDNIAYINYSHYTPTAQRNITTSGLEGNINASSYFGTIGTIAGVAVLVAIVIGAFYFVTKK